MRERNKIILEYGTYMLSFFVSYIASLAKWYYASGIILMVEAVYLYVWRTTCTRRPPAK